MDPMDKVVTKNGLIYESFMLMLNDHKKYFKNTVIVISVVFDDETLLGTFYPLLGTLDQVERGLKSKYRLYDDDAKIVFDTRTHINEMKSVLDDNKMTEITMLSLMKNFKDKYAQLSKQYHMYNDGEGYPWIFDQLSKYVFEFASQIFNRKVFAILLDNNMFDRKLLKLEEMIEKYKKYYLLQTSQLTMNRMGLPKDIREVVVESALTGNPLRFPERKSLETLKREQRDEFQRDVDRKLAEQQREEEEQKAQKRKMYGDYSGVSARLPEDVWDRKEQDWKENLEDVQRRIGIQRNVQDVIEPDEALARQLQEQLGGSRRRSLSRSPRSRRRSHRRLSRRFSSRRPSHRRSRRSHRRSCRS